MEIKTEVSEPSKAKYILNNKKVNFGSSTNGPS